MAKWVTAYLPGFRRSHPRPAEIDQNTLSHLIYFSAIMKADGTYLTGPLYTGNSLSQSDAADLLTLGHAANKKVLMCLNQYIDWTDPQHPEGLWTFIEAMTNHKSTLIANTITLLSYGVYGSNTDLFDGFDIDIEPLPTWKTGLQALYVDFVTALRAHASMSGKMITTAVGNGAGCFYITAAAHNSTSNGAPGKNFDQVNIMGYVMTYPYGGDWEVWHNAPLSNKDANGAARHFYHAGSVVLPSNESWAADLIAAGVEAKYIGIGVEAAGQVWSGGQIYKVGHDAGGGYRGVQLPNDDWGGAGTSPPMPSLASDVPYSDDFSPSIMGTYYSVGNYHFDPLAKVPYISIVSDIDANCKFISYDDEASIAAKIASVNANGFGGLVVYELGVAYRSGLPAGQRDLLMQAAAAMLTGENPTQPTLTVAPATVNVNSDPGMVTFQVTNTGAGDMGWTAVSDSDWAVITSGMSGTAPGPISVGYSENTSETTPRTATITITSPGATGSPKAVTIVQGATPPVPDEGANVIETLANVKVHLGIGSSDTAKDAVLQKWINECSGWIESFCNCKFAVQDIVGELLDGDGTQLIYPRWNIYGFYSADWSDDFKYKNDPTDAAWAKIETVKENILFNPRDPQKFRLYACLPVGWNNVRISYKAGMSPIPSDVIMVLVDMVQMRWNESKQGNDWLGKSADALSGGSSANKTYKDMKPEWYQVLAKYRRMVL